MTHPIGLRPFTLSLLLLAVVTALPSIARADGDADGDVDADTVAAFRLPELRQPYHSVKTPRRGAAGARFHASVGGGLAIGSLWMDYTVDSRYQVEKNGLVQDDEIRQYYFLAQPMLDVELGAELARDHLVLGFHFAMTGMMERVSAAMVAEWSDGNDTVIDKVSDRRYTMALAMIGLGGHYVFLPDRKFTPLVGVRFGMGITWDADYHMIDAWKYWYKNEDPDIDRGLYIRYRVPIMGGLDLGARLHLSDQFAIAIHIPAELLFTHGYLRGAILGVNARAVIRL